MKRLWPFAAIVLAAGALWAPTLALDVGRGDSLDLNLIWSNQFSALVRHGQLYPRWMPASFEGLGSPTFYFYPPLAFWGVSVVAALGGEGLSTLLQLKLAALDFLAMSGLTMFLWLKTQTTAARALICAVIFMAAPYHMDDHYIRGAFAEFLAIGVIPLVALGLVKTARRERFGPMVLAASYGALILAHLPTALLTSVLLIAPYAALLAWRTPGARVAFLARSAAALVLGVGLAAIYLVPALLLQRFISAEYLWSPKFNLTGQLFANPHAWTMPFVALLALASALETAMAVLAGMGAWRAGDRATAFWAGLAALIFLVMTGLVPGFWAAPLMAKVQFPWRAMAVQEFALVTLLALSPTLSARRLGVLLAALALANPGLAAAARNLLRGEPAGGLAPPAYAAALMADPLDAPEYLPQGMLAIHGGDPSPKIAFATLKALPLAAGEGVSAAADPKTGSVALTFAPARSGPVVVRRFYFPGWRAHCGASGSDVAPSGPSRLASFTPPSGARACVLRIDATTEERVGGWLSLASLALVLAWTLAAASTALRSRQRPLAGQRPPGSPIDGAPPAGALGLGSSVGRAAD
ncbi:MAG: hypothetical protein ACHP7N_00380 [Caulobacterales bacterium]